MLFGCLEMDLGPKVMTPQKNGFLGGVRGGRGLETPPFFLIFFFFKSFGTPPPPFWAEGVGYETPGGSLREIGGSSDPLCAKHFN